MKKIVRYILLYTLCLSSTTVSAQLQSNAERRKMYRDVLELVNNYEKYAEVSGINKANFVRLFRDSSTPIYNDLMGLSDVPYLSVHEYADFLAADAILPEVVIRNVSHDTPWYSNGRWHMHVSFAKELEYMDSCGIFEFSSRKHYGNDYQMNALVSWDEKGAKIDSLMGFIDTEVAPYPINYMIFEPRDSRDTTDLLYYGNPIVPEYYDGKAYAILPRESAKSFDYSKDKDVHVRLKHDANNIVYMTYRPKRWRMKARYEQALATYDGENGGFDFKKPLNVEGVFEFNNDTKDLDRKKDWSSSFNHTASMRGLGLDFGYIFPSRGGVKWGFFSGVALRQTNIVTASSTVINFHRKTTTEDEDGDSYLRKYSNVKDLRYETTVNEWYFPIYFDMDMRFSDGFSIYLDFGAKVYWAPKNPITKFSAGNYSVTGSYRKYGDYEFKENTFGDGYVLNGFENGEKLEEANIYSPLPGYNYGTNFSVDAFAGLGLRIRLYKDLYLDLGCNYQYNVGDVVDYVSENEWFDIGTRTDYGLKDLDYLCEYKEGAVKDPLYYDLKQGKEVVTSVSQYYKKIDRNALQFNVGLMFRF